MAADNGAFKAERQGEQDNFLRVLALSQSAMAGFF
jgi:hypothetical protein